MTAPDPTAPDQAAPLEVAYDISELGWMHGNRAAKRGVDRVVENVCEALLRHPACRVTLTAAENSWMAGHYFAQRPDKPPFVSLARDYPLHHLWSRLAPTRGFVMRTENRALHLRIARRVVNDYITPAQLWVAGRLRALDPEQFDVFQSPAFMPFPPYVRRAKRPVRFLTVYDLIPLRYPQMGAAALGPLRRALAGVGPEDFMVCISQYVKDEVCEYLRHDPRRVFVAPLAASAQTFYPCADVGRLQSVRQRYGVPEGPYLLSLCALDQRKNIFHLIECFARLTREHPSETVTLVLVGSALSQAALRLRDTIAAHGMQERVRLTGFVADEDLAALYSGSAAFVFPSLAEGFGLPPLEAMQCGVPVISSNRTSLPEVVGDAGLLVDPEDADALCQAMHRVLSDAGLRADLSARSLARAGQFSWERCARDYVAAYKTARTMRG